MNREDLEALFLTLELAITTAVVLVLVGSLISYLLLYANRVTKAGILAVVSLPLVLPPTVLGFYLLVVFSPDSLFGQAWAYIFGSTLAFSYEGILLGSIIFSLPFAVYPIHNAINNIPNDQLEAAQTFGLSNRSVFIKLLIPASRGGLITAFVLSFAHTIGEFGVVLMIGGSLPGETKVLSIALLEQVELMQYERAHIIALTLVVFSLLILTTFFWREGRRDV